MAEDNRDMLMKFAGVSGEGQAVVDTPAHDPLAQGFSPGGFFEVLDFDFGVNQIDDDGGAGASPALEMDDDTLKKYGFTRDARGTILDKDGKPVVEPRAAQFGRFKNEGSRGKGKQNYPADLAPFGFSRRMDIGSLDLFKGLVTLKTFPSVSLIKRKAVGGTAPGTHSLERFALRSYLRFDFTDVLLTSLDWDEDDVIREKIKFVCRGIRIQYLAERPGGALDKVPLTRSWTLRNDPAR